jgi:hypothetical protein
MRGFPLQDEGPGMNELFHDLQVEQEEQRAKAERCKHPPCREPEYCGWAAYCGATDILK